MTATIRKPVRTTAPGPEAELNYFAQAIAVEPPVALVTVTRGACRYTYYVTVTVTDVLTNQPSKRTLLKTTDRQAASAMYSTALALWTDGRRTGYPTEWIPVA